ncbi:MAG: kinase [Chloroflexi bacterium]|nr:kinase [Chloroflexota bacterium]
MIITRTPFRISFFGGGTDYPVWFEEHGGSVLATTIDKYCYITSRYLPPFFEHKSRIAYSTVEHVKTHDEIQHPSARECLRFMGMDAGVEIHHDGDLPARTGLGSSSAFTVGLLHALYALRGTMPGKERLAREAIHVEQDLIQEAVGCQDQTLAAYGGFNLVEFSGKNHFAVQPVVLPTRRLEELQDHLMLFFTGFSRYAPEVAAEQVRETPNRTAELRAMHEMVGRGLGILSGEADIGDFGRLLDESWRIKRTLSSRVSTPAIDEMYEAALSEGALGGKLLGAGGGGFMVVFARPADQPRIRSRLSGLLRVPFRFETGGSQVVFYNPSEPHESPKSVPR